MEELFRKYCRYLDQEQNELKDENPILLLRQKLKNHEIDFYDFLDSMYQWNKVPHILSKTLIHTGIEKVEITDNCVVYTTKRFGIKLVFDGRDRRGLPFELQSFGEYEKDEMMLFDLILNNQSTIFDIGANIGWYALNWSKQFPQSSIYAFEPIPETYDFFKTNITINGSRNIYPNQLAFSDTSGKTTYYFTPESSVLASEKNILDYKNAQKIPVETTTVDNFIQQNKIECLDVIKCDVEGAELNVVKGALRTIEKHQPVIVLELFHEWSKWFNYHPDEALALLSELDYLVFLPENGKLEKINSYQGGDFSRQNFFFMHAKKHCKLIQKLEKLP